MVTSRMLLVVVGNIDRARLEPLVQQTLAQLPRGSYTGRRRDQPAIWDVRSSCATPRCRRTTSSGYYAGPAARDPDYQALRIATAVLSGRFFTEIRSRRNLSYEVDAPFVERALVDRRRLRDDGRPEPDAARSCARRSTRLQAELIDPQGLERLVQQFITDYFLKNETNGDQATFLARAQIYHGDYRAANRFVDDLRQVRPEDVRRVARQYMHDFRFVYFGKPDALDRSILDRF